MRDLKRRNYKSIKTDYESAQNREMVFDSLNGNIIIKKTDGNDINLYDEVLKKCIDKDILKPLPIIYGIDISNNESDPNDAVLYTDDSRELVGATINNDGTIDYGSWEDKISNMFGVMPCVMKNGVVIKELTFSNYLNEVIDDDADLMIRFKKNYYSIFSKDNNLCIRLSNYNAGEGYSCKAFEKDGVEKDYMYIGVYEGFVKDNKLRSIPNVIPTTNKSLSEFKSCSNIGNGYDLIDIYKWQYINILLNIIFKSSAPNLILGNGNISDIILPTKSITNNGPFFATKNSRSANKFFGLENFTGNVEIYIDKLGCHNNKYYLIDSSTELSDINLGWVSQMMGNNGILCPSEYNGNSGSYYASNISKFGDINDESVLVTNNKKLSGLYSMLIAGPADYTSNSVGTRLIYL